MGFPWRAVITGGVSFLLKKVKPSVGVLISHLIDEAEEAFQEPGSGLQKAEKFTDDFISRMKNDGIDITGEAELLRKVQQYRDLEVDIRNIIESLKRK